MAGQSTFMVELTETSRILSLATPRSMVILDELGRGTSTSDGYAIAFAVLFHLTRRIQCLGLFSTHYRNLTLDVDSFETVDSLLYHDAPPSETCPSKSLKSVRNMHMACLVDEGQREVVFLYKLTDGASAGSYGANVASMAGIPESIIRRSESIGREMCSVDNLELFRAILAIVSAMKSIRSQPQIIAGNAQFLRSKVLE